MKLLRRTLYWEAALLALGGLVLATWPTWPLRTFFGAPPTDEVWVRMVGVQAVGFSLLYVVIGHRLEQLWWATWAFVLTGAGVAFASITYALFGVRAGESPALWWAIGLVATAFTAALLVGLAIAGTQRDPNE